MYIRHSERYKKPIKIIHPGEYYVSTSDEIIGTLLGSCVALCLIDLKNGIAGMNHFMLPGRIASSDIFSDKTARYGITAINHLLSAIENSGSSKLNLVAKIFGGGHVLEAESESMTIPQDNIRLARIMMEIEDIPIIKSDVGDDFTRKLLLDVKTGKVYLRKTTRKEVFDEIIKRDKEFAKRSFLNE